MKKTHAILRLGRWLALPALVALAVAGCTLLRDAATRLPGPRYYEKAAAVIGEIRAFEQRIGFKETDNFADLDHETESYPFCGYVSRLYLPYSYEDPAIHWGEEPTEEECQSAAGAGADVYFGQTEAVGESGTPVTPSMLAGTLARFVYLVFHEDCHDQFGLPQGIEEALCNVIAYHAMAAFGRDRRLSGSAIIERVAMNRFAERESERTRMAKAFYDELAALYGRHQRDEMTTEALLAARAGIFAKAETALAWEKGSLNNVGIANDMTYSRHFPFLESVHDALGRDLGKTVAFFRQVDAIKPDRARVVKRHGLRNDQGLDFIRAYEAAVLETVKKTLSDSTRR
ncbi:MAG: aminopeptidase [Betaproteobacteria bacterium]|nr:aminopeptidase [Betaproteobacteria bacterium]